jgi:HEAT repeat protein
MRAYTWPLVVTACLGLAGAARADDPAKAVAEDEKALTGSGLKTDSAALLEFFRQRTLNAEEKARVEALIKDLGAPGFKTREQASAHLIARGPVALEQLKGALASDDPEVVRRAERCIQRIQEKDYAPQVGPAAARLLRQRKPAEAVPVLLAFLPFADNENIADEVRNTLTALAVRDGKTEPALVAALADKMPVVRGSAGEALTRAGVAGTKAEVRKLLADPDATVRLRVATALTLAREKVAVPVVINALPDLGQNDAIRAEDLLYRLADGRTPPRVSPGSDAAARRKCRDAWLVWWQTNEKTVNLAKLSERPAQLGYTLVVLLDEGIIREVGRDDKTRWEVSGLVFPLDVQYLPGDRILVAEYHAARVTERNHKGDILWQQRFGGPLMAQRLANGNTFIASDTRFVEVDRSGKEVFSHDMPAGERVMKAVKTPSGDIVCMTTDGRVLRLNGTGKELGNFPVQLTLKLFGGRLDVLPTGRVLVPHNAEGKVVEYDLSGKPVWQVMVEQPIAAVRLPNGHTLVTSMSQKRAVEFDRAGHEVWQYRASTRVTRALRR